MISEQDVQAYKRGGVIVVPDVLGAATLDEVRKVIASPIISEVAKRNVLQGRPAIARQRKAAS